MKKLILVAIAFFCLTAFGKKYQTLSIKSELAHFPCSTHVLETIKGFKPEDQWVKHIGDKPSQFVYKTPSKNYGKWVKVVPTLNSVNVQLMNSKSSMSILFDGKSCLKTSSLLKASPVKTKAPHITDLDIYNIIKKEKKGVIYTWSTNMPLSAQGYAEINKAAKKLNLKVHSYVEPNSDRKLVKEFSTRYKIPESAQVENHSFDLMMRGASLHFPSIILFENGKIKRWGKHGFEKEDGYLDFLKSEFNL